MVPSTHRMVGKLDKARNWGQALCNGGAGIYTEQVKLGHLLPFFWSSMNLSCSLPPMGPRPSTLWGVRESALHDHRPGTSAQWLSRMGSLLLPGGRGGLGGERAGHSVWLCQWFRCTLQGSGPVILLFMHMWWEIFPELRSVPVGPPFNPSMAACHQAPGSLQVEAALPGPPVSPASCAPAAPGRLLCSATLSLQCPSSPRPLETFQKLQIRCPSPGLPQALSPLPPHWLAAC